MTEAARPTEGSQQVTTTEIPQQKPSPGITLYSLDPITPILAATFLGIPLIAWSFAPLVILAIAAVIFILYPVKTYDHFFKIINLMRGRGDKKSMRIFWEPVHYNNELFHAGLSLDNIICSNPQKRINSLKMLKDYKSDAVGVTPILLRLHDQDEKVREEARKAYEELKDNPALQELFSTPETKVLSAISIGCDRVEVMGQAERIFGVGSGRGGK